MTYFNFEAPSGEILYNNWIETKQVKFARMFNSIKEYLPYIKSGPLSLYVIYLIHSKNDVGSSFPSISSMAKILDVSDRTINTWNNRLIDLGLIYRENHGSKSSSTTFLLPTSDYIMFKKEKRIVNALKELGYKDYDQVINFIQKKNNTYLSFRYEMMYRNYGEITRKVYFAKKNDIGKINKEELKTVNISEGEFKWFKNEENELEILVNDLIDENCNNADHLKTMHLILNEVYEDLDNNNKKLFIEENKLKSSVLNY